MNYSGSCNVVGLFLASIIGVMTSLFFVFGYLVEYQIVNWIILIVALISLVLVIVGVIVGFVSGNDCIQRTLVYNNPLLIAGIMGSILSNLIALIIINYFDLIWSILLFGFIGFFFVLILVGWVCFIYSRTY